MSAHRCRTGWHAEPHRSCYDKHGCRCTGCRAANTHCCAQMDARAAANKRCPNCAGPGGRYADGLCKACYTYRRRHGRDRPPDLYDPPPRHCTNCDRRMPHGKPRRRGRCEACARYLDRNGRERPRRLVEAA